MNICQGVQLHVLETTKFKDVGFYFRFIQPLRRETATVYSLLALMMSDRLEIYPTKQKMSQRLDELYGMSIGAQTIGYGQAQVLELRAKMIHPRFAEDKSLLDEGIHFLREMILRPLLSEDSLKEAKRILLSKLKRMRDDASQYVVHQGLKYAGKDHALAISALGEEEILQKTTLEEIKEAHRALLEESGIDVIVCGDLDRKHTIDAIGGCFEWKPRKKDIESYYAIDSTDSPEIIQETRSIPQTSLMQVYFTHTDVKDPKYYALRVMNAMLGQYSTSLLFQNVREKNSLCYSIYSNLIAFDGAMGITTGIEKKDIDQVLTLIQEQIETLKNGTFDEELLTVTKTMIINSLKAGDDVMNTMATLRYQNDLLNREYTSKDIIECIQKVTRADVIEMAQRLEQKTTYIVTSEEGTDEENR